MQVKDIVKLKSDFGEYAFFNLDKLQTHLQSKNAALIYFLFDELLQKNVSDSYINKTLNLDNMKEQDMFTFEFSTKNKDKKLLVKGLYQKDENNFSLNCLKKFGQEEMHSADVKLYDRNLSLDGYLIEQSNIVYEQIIKNIQNDSKSKQRDKREEFRLKPRVIDDDIFSQPERNARPPLIPNIPGYMNPPQNMGPGIRWDPLLPPGLDPNPNPDPNAMFGFGRNNGPYHPTYYENTINQQRSQRNNPPMNPLNAQPNNFFSHQRNNMNPF